MTKILSFFPDRIALFRSAKMNTELFYNLVHVASSDGLLHEKEIQILMEEAIHCGISHDVAQKLMTYSEDINYVPPRSESESKIFLEKLVKIALADGTLSVREMEIINKKRIELNISKTYLEALIKTSEVPLKKQA
jgi:uncharacterized membrane protein YebE (DUF533 family)